MHPSQITLVLHIAIVAAWFGMSVGTPGRIRRGLQAGDAETKFMAAETARALKLSFIFGILALVSGLTIVFQTGGFKVADKTIHMAMGIVLLMVGIEFINQTIWKGGLQKLNESGDKSGLIAAKGKIAMFGGIQQLLWFVVLCLMVLN
jgi:hypothetical protein